MRLPKKRALIGYEPDSVVQAVQTLQKEFTASVEAEHAQLASLQLEIAELEEQLKRYTEREGHTEAQQLQDEMAALLLEAHLELVRGTVRADPKRKKGEKGDEDELIRT